MGARHRITTLPTLFIALTLLVHPETRKSVSEILRTPAAVSW